MFIRIQRSQFSIHRRASQIWATMLKAVIPASAKGRLASENRISTLYINAYPKIPQTRLVVNPEMEILSTRNLPSSFLPVCQFHHPYIPEIKKKT